MWGKGLQAWLGLGSQQKVSVAFPDPMSRGLTTPTSTSWETKEKDRGNENRKMMSQQLA